MNGDSPAGAGHPNRQRRPLKPHPPSTDPRYTTAPDASGEPHADTLIATPWASPRANSVRLLPPKAREALLGIAVSRRWRNGQTLLWTGERAGSAFVVARGRIRMRSFGPEGDEQIFGWMEPGTFGALASVLGDARFPCDFVADGACEVLHLPRERLLELLARDAPTALALARMLSVRLSLFMEMHMVQSFAPLADRVWATIRRLARWSSAKDGTRTGTLDITQADLAHAVGASRYRVGLELQRLAATGRLRLSRGRIVATERR